MALTKRQLQSTLDALARAQNRMMEARAKIADHCMEVYGVDPSDVDNDQFIDSCDGGSGAASGMTAEAFHRSMLECIARAGALPKS